LEYSEANKKSHKLDINYCKSFINEWGEKTRLKDIIPQKLERFKTKKKKVNADATVNRYLEALSKMFNVAIANNLIKENSLKQVNYKIRFLSKNEEIRLFEVLDKNSHYHYLKPIVLCSLQTGMRRGEILHLEWTNIDFYTKHIELLQTKSGKSRKIPISTKFMNELQKLKANKVSEYVFTNQLTKTKYTEIKKGFNKALEKAEIHNFRFHDLRHTAATRMTEMGIDLAVVQEKLGHSDVRTTMRYPVSEKH
jgi:integrase